MYTWTFHSWENSCTRRDKPKIKLLNMFFMITKHWGYQLCWRVVPLFLSKGKAPYLTPFCLRTDFWLGHQTGFDQQTVSRADVRYRISQSSRRFKSCNKLLQDFLLLHLPQKTCRRVCSFSLYLRKYRKETRANIVYKHHKQETNFVLISLGNLVAVSYSKANIHNSLHCGRYQQWNTIKQKKGMRLRYPQQVKQNNGESEKPDIKI